MAKKRGAKKKPRVVERKVIGILDSASPASRGEEIRAFYQGLTDSGVDGSRAMVLYCWADNDGRLLEKLASELEAKADIIVAAGGPSSALAAKNAHRPVRKPIIFTTIADPRQSKLVSDIYRPEGLITGTFGYTTESDRERMHALNELLTYNSKIGGLGALINPERPYPIEPKPEKQESDLEGWAPAGRAVSVVSARNEMEIDDAFDKFKIGGIAGLLVTADPVLSSHHEHIIKRAKETKIPTIYQWPDMVRAGGLMSFGPSKAEGYLNAGEYAGRLLMDPSQPVRIPKVKETVVFTPFIHVDVATELELRIPRLIRDKVVEKIRSPNIPT